MPSISTRLDNIIYALNKDSGSYFYSISEDLQTCCIIAHTDRGDIPCIFLADYVSENTDSVIISEVNENYETFKSLLEDKFQDEFQLITNRRLKKFGLHFVKGDG